MRRVSRPGSFSPRFVIHTVGPVWRGGSAGEDAALASAYRNSLRLAAENGLATIAFPAISTGVYAFPLERAAALAVRTVRASLEEHPSITRVELVCFGEAAERAFTRAL